MVDRGSDRSENRPDEEHGGVATLQSVGKSCVPSHQEDAGHASDEERCVRYYIQCIRNSYDELSLVCKVVILLRLRDRRRKKKQADQGGNAETEEPPDVPHRGIVSRNRS